jgi:hypothetical protein
MVLAQAPEGVCLIANTTFFTRTAGDKFPRAFPASHASATCRTFDLSFNCTYSSYSCVSRGAICTPLHQAFHWNDTGANQL